MGEQGGGHLNVGHAAHVGGRNEAREIAHHAPAEGEDHVSPSKRVAKQAMIQLDRRVEALVRVARRKREGECLPAILVRDAHHVVGKRRLGDDLVGDDRDLPAGEPEIVQQLRQRAPGSRAHQHGIGALYALHVQSDHRRLTRAWYAWKASSICSRESPPNFSKNAPAITQATTFSPTTDAAGRAQMSERSMAAGSGCFGLHVHAWKRIVERADGLHGRPDDDRPLHW